MVLDKLLIISCGIMVLLATASAAREEKRSTEQQQHRHAPLEHAQLISNDTTLATTASSTNTTTQWTYLPNWQCFAKPAIGRHATLASAQSQCHDNPNCGGVFKPLGQGGGGTPYLLCDQHVRPMTALRVIKCGPLGKIHPHDSDHDPRPAARGPQPQLLLLLIVCGTFKDLV